MNNRRHLMSFWTVVLIITSITTKAQEVTVNVNTDDVLCQRQVSLIGANIEDLNNQLYGGLYSQLLYGEAFEEEIGVDFIGLSELEKLQVWVRRDDKNQPYLWYFDGRDYPAANNIEKEIGNKFEKPVDVGRLRFTSPFLAADELQGNLGKELNKHFFGSEQISRHWHKVQSNTAQGTFLLDLKTQFTGEQAQQITFLEGEGEWGISNAGLNSLGIRFVKGKNYDGILRVKSEKPQSLHLSLRDENGNVLDKKQVQLKGIPNEYQRITFSLIPQSNTVSGQFVITLRQPGAITVDYAFLEPGEWGRYQKLPVRLEMAEAIKNMTVKTIRYNGSMVNRSPEGFLYKWKEMIGPRDERTPYHGWFNPYSSHGFTFFDFMDLCEAMNIDCMFGIRADETVDDVKDLNEYCLGDANTKWGKKRIELGHPKPYRLQTIQIGNEEKPDDIYVKQVIQLAGVIWEESPNTEVALSVNVGRKFWTEQYNEGMLKIAEFVHKQNKSEKIILDAHYRSDIEHADSLLSSFVGLSMHDTIAKHFPGFELRLWPMEENGERCDWDRGLAHAHNLNTLNRFPTYLERSGTANTFQAWQQQLIWDQGRIHFTPEKIFYQPSYYVDRMFGVEWLPVVVKAESSEETLDVTAKKNKEGDVLILYVVNINPEKCETEFKIEGYYPKKVDVTRIASPDLTAHNTPDNPEEIISQSVKWDLHPKKIMQIPGYSFTKIRFEK